MPKSPPHSSPGEDTGYDTGRSSPESDYSLSSFVKLKDNDAGLSITLQVDLGPYIDSYKRGDDTAHAAHRATLEDMVQGVMGSDLWAKTLNAVLSKAIQEHRIIPKECLVIQNSPACEFMISSFVESVKNLMDEAILGHYENGKSPQLEMKIDIDASSPDRIKLTMTDNGRGFPQEFLAKNATSEDRQVYIMESGSGKKLTPDKATMKDTELSRETTPPKLFGGAGLGLRILMAAITRGDKLTGPGRLQPKYEIPAVSEITLSNRKDTSGTLVQITTSRTPLKEKIEEASASAAPLKLSMPPRMKKSATSIAAATSARDEPAAAAIAPILAAKDLKGEMAKLRLPGANENRENMPPETRPK